MIHNFLHFEVNTKLGSMEFYLLVDPERKIHGFYFQRENRIPPTMICKDWTIENYEGGEKTTFIRKTVLDITVEERKRMIDEAYNNIIEQLNDTNYIL